MQEQKRHPGMGRLGINTSSLIRICALVLLLAGCNGSDSAPPPTTNTNQSVAGQWALSWVPANLPPSEACHMSVTLAANGDITATDFHGLQGPQKGTGSINSPTLAIMVAGYAFTGTLDSSGKTATGTMTNLTTGETTPATATRT